MTVVKQEVTDQHKCQYCGKIFIKEKSLIAHACNIKLRWMSKDEKYVRLGFYAYNRFYTIAYSNDKKTYDNFVKSKYYTAFVKFGKHLLDLNAVKPENFIDFLIKANVPLDDWRKDYPYELYIRELIKKESPEIAVERNIKYMEQWGKDTQNNWNDFFNKIEPTLAVHLIRTGRISPWVLYNSKSAQNLLEKFNDEQLMLINEYIDPKYWLKKLKINKDDKEYIENILKHAGL